jgi:hypothetical protein
MFAGLMDFICKLLQLAVVFSRPNPHIVVAVRGTNLPQGD